jgi:hypothetical protein
VTRTRLRAEWFSVSGKDRNHDYYHIMFSDEGFENDVIIEIEDLEKLRDELTKWIGDKE